MSAQDDYTDRLEAALEYAISIIESYQMDLRASAETLSAATLNRLAAGDSLATVGFCQGRIYADAIGRIRRIAAGVSKGL